MNKKPCDTQARHLTETNTNLSHNGNQLVTRGVSTSLNFSLTVFEFYT